MSTQSVQCNNCGAPLTVPAGTNYVTCNHCGSSLAVKHNESVAYTEVLERLDRRTEELAEQVTELSREAELTRIDRQWELEREQYLVSDKHGNRSVPSPAGALVGAGVAVVFGIFWTATTAQSHAPGFFPCFGVLFVLVAIFVGVQGFMKAFEYQDAYRRYQRRRATALRDRGDT